MKLKFPAKISLGLAALLALSAAAESDAGLDGATGHLFRMDLHGKTFELLNETEYDPQTDVRQSRFTVHWNGDHVVDFVIRLAKESGTP